MLPGALLIFWRSISRGKRMGDPDFQQLFINALVSAVMEPRTNEFGNPIMSGLYMTFSNWWNANKEAVINQVLPLIDIDDIAEKAAEKIVAELLEKPGFYTKN